VAHPDLHIRICRQKVTSACSWQGRGY
jgi:hypothetical protein